MGPESILGDESESLAIDCVQSAPVDFGMIHDGQSLMMARWQRTAQFHVAAPL